MTEKQPATFVLVALLIGAPLIAAGYALQHTMSSFLLSFVFAYLLDPLVVILERRRIPRLWSIAMLYFVLGVAALLCFTYFGPLVKSTWEALLRDLPRYIQKGKEMVAGAEGGLPSHITDDWRWLFDKLVSGIDHLVSKLGSGLYATASRVAFNLLNLLLAPILVFFMLYYKQDIIAGVASWLPLRHREVILGLGREVNSCVGGYIRGQMAVSFIVAVMSTIALFWLGIDYPVLNGIFAGVSSILPFIGVILATIPPLFFAYVKFQSGMMLVKVVATFAVIYFFEGYLIKPMVFKRSMDLNPLVTIMVVMAFGELMGFWGILLAIPIAAAMKIVTTHVRHGHFTSGE